MKHIMVAIIVLAAAGVGLLLYTWSGAYNIAATRPYWGVTLSFIKLLKDRSIAVHSGLIQAPKLEDAQKEAAFAHFHGMCRFCHGAPGYASLDFAGGFFPSPPSLISGRLQQEFSEAEIYWIVKHGIKMTGMPPETKLLKITATDPANIQSTVKLKNNIIERFAKVQGREVLIAETRGEQHED